MKKILFALLVIALVFIIYYINVDKNIYYLSLGDYLSYGVNNFEKVGNNHNEYLIKKYKVKKYINYSNLDDYRVMDLINDINYNKIITYKNKKYKMQNLLVKSNLITVSIGMNDLINKKDINLEYASTLLKDIDTLLITIRKYNKDKIYFLGFYDIINNKAIIDYSNKRLQDICKKKGIIFIDISKLNNYFVNERYPTEAGYSYIVNKFTK